MLQTIVTIDNEGESYAKLNGEDALLLSAFKASTAKHKYCFN